MESLISNMRRKLDSHVPFDVPDGGAIYRTECAKLHKSLKREKKLPRKA